VKSEIDKPKFAPNTQVVFYNNALKPQVVITVVDYCEYDVMSSKWFYHLKGWHSSFAEDTLKTLLESVEGFKLTYNH
jgi:hypothetical protein